MAKRECEKASKTSIGEIYNVTSPYQIRQNIVFAFSAERQKSQLKSSSQVSS